MKVNHDDSHDEYYLECSQCNLIFGLVFDGEMWRGFSSQTGLIKMWNEI